MPAHSLARLTGIFLRAGSFTFGGGDPTIAALHSELVTRRGWLPPDRYGLAYALARITPGTNMVAFCAGAAWLLAGWRGAALAVAAVTVPGSVYVVLLTGVYQTWRNNTAAMSVIGAALAAAVGLMAAAAWQLLWPQFASRDWRRILRAAAFAAGALALTWLAGRSPVEALGAAALAGAIWRGPSE